MASKEALNQHKAMAMGNGASQAPVKPSTGMKKGGSVKKPRSKK